MTPSPPRSIPFVAPIPTAPATKTPGTSLPWPMRSHVVNSPPTRLLGSSPASWSKGGREHMTTTFQRETAFAPIPPASPSRPLQWIPLDEVRQAWANFGAEALSYPALLATSNAFLALSWETSALRHHGMAHHAQQGGFSPE